MQRAKIVQEEIKENEIPFLALRLETKNANLILLSEGEDQLGTLAIALPQAEKMLGPPLSSILLGDRNTIITRLLAERLAQKTGKIALASVYVKTVSEQEAGKVFLKLFEKIMKQEESEAENR
jgi:hypothetical protein